MVQVAVYSIRQMVELTGLSEFTIRGWENRYSAFDPQRGETGRLEYRKADIERAILLRELLKRGHKIGKVAKLTNQRLQLLFEQTAVQRAQSKFEQRSELISHALELMALQKWPELKLFIKNVSAPNTFQLVQDFFIPALKALAENIAEGVVSISQEHIFSSFLKEKIYSALSDLESKKSSQRVRKEIHFVLASPEGDHHEIGLLLAQLLIRSHGFTSLYLGPHTPARDLAETALRFDASHLLVVSTVSKKGGARQELLSFITDVRKRIGPHLAFLIAGSQAPSVVTGAHDSFFTLRSFQHLEDYLQTIGAKP
jgi:DNA-binding transcriptional MerR regulator/methylmalonyl-CoA mutase cobalamin-binding subunit